MTERRYFEDYQIGEVFKGSYDQERGDGHTVTEVDIITFSATAADNNAIHIDQEFANKTVWKTRIQQGVCTFARSEGLLMRTHIYETIDELTYISLEVRYRNPVLIGDTITAEFTVVGKWACDRPSYGIIKLSRVVKNQRGETVLTATTENYVKMRSPA